MIGPVSVNQIKNAEEIRRDFYKSELLKMGYYKTPDGKQLYELSSNELEQIYENQKARKGELDEGEDGRNQT